MRKLSTAERRRQVAKLVMDERLPPESRSSRTLGKRFEVSHRTILNDLEALGLEPVGKAPAGGITKDERQRRLRELYPDHTFDEIAAILGCSDQTLKRDAEELKLERRKAAPRKRRPTPPPATCECGCGELARPGGRFVDWEHYSRWRRRGLEHLSGAVASLYDEHTITEIRDLVDAPSRDAVHRALRAAGVEMRRAARRPIVNLETRTCAICGDDIKRFPSHLRGRRVFCSRHWPLWTDALSKACWAVRGVDTSKPNAPELRDAFVRALDVGVKFEAEARQLWPRDRGRRPPLALDLAIEAMHVSARASDELLEYLINQLLREGRRIAPGLDNKPFVHGGYVKQRRKHAQIKRRAA